MRKKKTKMKKGYLDVHRVFDIAHPFRDVFNFFRERREIDFF